ncbi:class I SAM-dependent methyltransferase [Desulfonema magnum]|uniref:class I SAM-dependent methyltransferase n=1 Tax=Desulfonema magnum TaxID=45655 RepID=UPI001A9BB18F|nr:class I SAM-dependent methyltransferase [Desulfonema magnum]
MQNDLSIAREKFQSRTFSEAFDIYEQLIAAYPKQAVELLAEVYDCYQRFPYKDRYNLYQARQFDFGIKPSDKVLDIGSGHIPFPLATHLADIALEDHKYGRAGVPFKYVEGKPVFECSVEDTPFEDKEFDFVYCSHVLEHSQHPEKACQELMRIGKKGYIETPTKGKDIFFDQAKVSNHKICVEEFNSRLIFTEYTPDEIEGMQCNVLMQIHSNPQTIREKAFSALMYLKPCLINTMFLWSDKFEYEVRKFFTDVGDKDKKKASVNKGTVGKENNDNSELDCYLDSISGISSYNNQNPLIILTDKLFNSGYLDEAKKVCDLIVNQFGENPAVINLTECIRNKQKQMNQ